MSGYEWELSSLIREIGYARLLNLPKQIRDLLKETTDLAVKVKMLREIAKVYRTGGRA